MIVSRTPFRITLGGGGTDLPSYYSKFGGFIFSGIERFLNLGDFWTWAGLGWLKKVDRQK